MKTFVYTYKTKDNKTLTKKIKADSRQAAMNFLKKKNIRPKSLKVEGEGFLDQFRKDKVSDDDIVSFSQLFGGCVESGLTIKEALDLMTKQIKNKVLKDRISSIIVDIESGTQMSDSFKKHTDVFPIYYPMLLRAGEASGKLHEALEYIANYLDKKNNLNKQIIATLTYPVIVSLVGFMLIYVILIFVAPTFKDVFSSSGKALPLPTFILFYFSQIRHIIEINFYGFFL